MIMFCKSVEKRRNGGRKMRCDLQQDMMSGINGENEEEKRRKNNKC